MRILFVAGFLLFFCSYIFAQHAIDSTNTHTSHALTVEIDDFHLEGGIGGTYWINHNYSILLSLDGYYYQYTDLHHQILRTIEFYPTISIKRHFMTRTNVSPYIGGRIRMMWYIENAYGGKYTYFQPAILIGVESWVTDYISITGEQALGVNYDMNDHPSFNYNFSSATIFISFYF